MVSTFLKLHRLLPAVPGWLFAVVDAANRNFLRAFNVSLEIPQIGVAVGSSSPLILLAATSSISPAAPRPLLKVGKPVH